MVSINLTCSHEIVWLKLTLKIGNRATESALAWPRFIHGSFNFGREVYGCVASEFSSIETTHPYVSVWTPSLQNPQGTTWNDPSESDVSSMFSLKDAPFIKRVCEEMWKGSPALVAVEITPPRWPQGPGRVDSRTGVVPAGRIWCSGIWSAARERKTSRDCSQRPNRCDCHPQQPHWEPFCAQRFLPRCSSSCGLLDHKLFFVGQRVLRRLQIDCLVQGACRTVYMNSLQAELQTTMETSLRFPWGLISRIELFFAGDCQENIASKPISGSTPSILLLRVLLLPSVCCLKYVKIILNLCSSTFLILILLC